MKTRKKFRPPRPERPKPTPGWEREPKPLAGGVLVVGTCRSKQRIPIYVKDVVLRSKVGEILQAIRAGVKPSMPRCRHCGKPYENMRPMRQRQERAA